MTFHTDLNLELTSLKNSDLLRQLRPFKRREGAYAWDATDTKYLNFSSNDYLGLSVTQGSKEAHFLPSGSSGSRLLGGDTELTHCLEQALAKGLGKEAALLLNSGYHMNTGIFSALFNSQDVIFADKLCHASILDGIHLSKAKLFRFRHNDLNHLSTLLSKHRSQFRHALIVSESIFSMDGDMAPLNDLIALKTKHDSILMIDDAHGVGMEGANGFGLTENQPEIDIVAGTFGKALGSYGGYIASTRNIIDALINKCRSLIFSTALPEVVIARNLWAWERLPSMAEERLHVKTLSHLFRAKLANHFQVLGNSHIIPVITNNPAAAKSLEKQCIKAGIWVSAVRPPTVPITSCRLRFCITACHTEAHLEEAIYALCL